MPAILIVDDDQNLLRVLRGILRELDADIRAATNVESALSAMQSESFDLVVTDLKMPGLSGMDLLRRSLRTHPSVPVIMMSAFGTVEAAVDAMKQGAYDFITKPFDPDELLQTARKALCESGKNRELLSPYFDEEKSFTPEIIGRTPVIMEILRSVKRVAPTEASVLIAGETGVGKELVARALHLASRRRTKPFVKVNCAAIPDALLESDLFGHEKGAFTGAVAAKPGRFELANGGTIFLDEIGELPLNLQAKLLAFIQDKTVERVGGVKTIRIDARIVSATNRDLAIACRNGLFRSDLFYRLNVVPVCIPPLRERREDIVPLAEYFIHRLEAKYQRKTQVPEMVWNALIAYAWPGNIRELENVLERLFVLSEGTSLDSNLLPLEIGSGIAPAVGSSYKSRTGAVVRGAEKQMIVDALNSTDQNRTRAAKLLGISRRTLQNKIKDFGL
ncbi:MAG TPA: sigma-54 dependent transcriptional regulator [Acidobacteriota bacterium]|nr:sigma-54 dependent transcriptional regulator [Acidobacteriota bacterium]